MRAGYLGPVDRQFFVCARIEDAPNPLNGLGDLLGSGASLCPLEGQVFNKVKGAGLLFLLIAAASTNEDGHTDGIAIGNGAGDYAQPIFQTSLFKQTATSQLILGRTAQPVKPAENNFKGRLFFLIDGHGFSTTGHLCALLKYHKLGTFIGTETGGTYTCNAAGRTIQLKNTRLLLEISRKSFVAAVTGLPKNRGIIPDFIINEFAKNEPALNNFNKLALTYKNIIYFG